jgi:hypothetical protein
MVMGTALEEFFIEWLLLIIDLFLEFCIDGKFAYWCHFVPIVAVSDLF